jgi:glycosyltransferase involved in cell wall biosynthesis
MRLAIISSHPIQYYAPWFKYMSSILDVHVFYMQESKKQGSAKGEFGTSFEWDVDLLEGYKYTFLKNISKNPGVNNFKGCDVPEIYSTLKKGQFEAVLVMGWYLKGFLQAITACKIYKIPLLVRGDSKLDSSNSGLKKIIKKIFYPLFFKFFDVFLYVGEKNKEYLEYFGVPKTKLVFCPHFINQSFFSQNINNFNKAELIKEMNLRENSFKLLFVGKFIEIKKTIDILKAIKLIRKDELEIELLLVGDGILDESLRNYCKKNCNFNVHFLGFKNQSELPEIYYLSDALILPSQSETWGLVVNEAFALNTPAVVSADVGCGPDLMRSGLTGEVFECGNINDLAKKIKLISKYSKSETSKKEIQKKNKIYSIEVATENLTIALNSLK